MSGGIVSFVGTGSGDSALHTVRAGDRLARADVVVSEQAATPAARLVDMARQGKRVVVTLAGDPAESPRALDQIREVARSGMAFEVVAGVGARAAACAFAGVVGHAVRVATDAVEDAVRGEDPDRALTLIAGVGGPSQRVVVTPAGKAAAWAESLGENEVIVAFGVPDPDLRWFERRPLFGKRVLVTRARDQATGTAALLRDRGAEPVVLPTIAIHAPADHEPLARALSRLRAGAYAWVAFTSANGVARTWEALVGSGGDARAFGAARLAAIGPATASALGQHGLRADVVAKEFRGEGLADELLHAMGSLGHGSAVAAPRAVTVLIARAARARDVLPETLRGAGCEVDVVAAYETHPAGRDAAARLVSSLESGGLDAVMLTSSSTVDNLCDLLGPRAYELLARTRVASIGPVTTETARARGLRVDVTAAEYTVEGLVDALEHFFSVRPSPHSSLP